MHKKDKKENKSSSTPKKNSKDQECPPQKTPKSFDASFDHNEGATRGQK